MAIIPLTEVGLGIIGSQAFLSEALAANCIEIANPNIVAQIQGTAAVLGSFVGEKGAPLSVSVVQLMLERKPNIWSVDAVAMAMQHIPAPLFKSAAEQAKHLLRETPILEDRETTRASLIQCIAAEKILQAGIISEDPFGHGAEIYVAPIVGMVLENIIGYHPSNWESLVISVVETLKDKTIDALVENDLSTAEVTFEQLLHRVSLKEKDHAQALFEVGNGFLKKMRFREAEQAFMKSVAIDDHLPKTWICLAYALRENTKEMEKRKLENILYAVNKTIKLEHDTNALTHFLKGLILFEMKDQTQAEIAFVQALRLEAITRPTREPSLTSLVNDVKSGVSPIAIWRVVFDIAA